MYYGLGINMS